MHRDLVAKPVLPSSHRSWGRSMCETQAGAERQRRHCHSYATQDPLLVNLAQGLPVSTVVFGVVGTLPRELTCLRRDGIRCVRLQGKIML